MPSPTAGLFGGLAQGIFGRMREHEDEQRKLDLEDKKNALSSLSSLLESATPETRPVIYKQMADVMSLKGKHRGVWDMLTGGGRDDYHQQLSQKLDGVFGNVVGPEQYEQLKSHPEAGYGGLPAAGGPAWASPTVTQTTDRTAGKVALLDPTLERQKILQATYGLRSQADSNKLWEGAEAKNYTNEIKGDLGKDRDAAKITLTATMKAQGDILKRGMQMAQAQGRAKPTDDDLQAAALQLGTETGNHDEALQALTALRKAQTQYFANGGSQGADKPVTQYQQIGIDKDQQARGLASYKEWTQHVGKINELGAKQTDLRKQLSQINPMLGTVDTSGNYKFDEARGVFIGPDGKDVTLVSKPVQAMVNQVMEAEREKGNLKALRDAARKTLETYHGQQFKFGDEWGVEPNSEYGAVAPAGAPRTGQPPPFPAGAAQGKRELAAGEQAQWVNKELRPKGSVVDLGGKKFRVDEVKPIPGGGYSYILTKVE